MESRASGVDVPMPNLPELVVLATTPTVLVPVYMERMAGAPVEVAIVQASKVSFGMVEVEARPYVTTPPFIVRSEVEALVVMARIEVVAWVDVLRKDWRKVMVDEAPPARN